MTAERTGIAPYRYERPPFGEFGSVATVGERLVCHLCGRDFIHLGTHIVKVHGCSVDEYRAIFGLMAKTKLIARSLKVRLREALLRDPQRINPGSPEHMRAMLAARMKQGTAASPEALRRRAIRRQRAPQPGRLSVIGVSTCTRGHVWDGFVTKKQRLCRLCNRENVKRWRREHPDRLREQRRRHRLMQPLATS